jgi:hypothetical protein
MAGLSTRAPSQIRNDAGTHTLAVVVLGDVKHDAKGHVQLEGSASR